MLVFLLLIISIMKLLKNAFGLYSSGMKGVFLEKDPENQDSSSHKKEKQELSAEELAEMVKKVTQEMSRTGTRVNRLTNNDPWLDI